MAFDVSQLTDYVKQEAANLVSATLLAPRTAKFVTEGGTVLTGVKSKEQIGNLETDAVFQDGTSCAFNSSGSTVFSKREVEVGAIRINEAICPKDLEKKYTQKMLSIGATYEDPNAFSYAKYWAERKVAKAGVASEVALWQGDKSSGNAQLNKFDGYLKQINAGYGAGVIDANQGALTAAQVTKAEILGILDDIFMSIPSALLEAEDFRIFTGYDMLRLASIAGRDSKYFKYTTEIVDGTIVVPGTNIKLVAVGGLNGKTHFTGLRLSNMFIGTDLVSDETKFDLWYSQDDRNVKYANEFKLGANVAILDEIVDWKAAS
jgi:hypothetical protein